MKQNIGMQVPKFVQQDMPFKLEELQKAHQAYNQFLARNPPVNHARYIFPFFAGSYFSYRKVDVLRVVAIANAAADIDEGNKSRASNDKDYAHPSYLDVGCGYGDFLKRVREFLPNAEGVEKEGGIFYVLGRTKPDYIEIAPIESLSGRPMDVIFVGWMEPGVDFRRDVAKNAKCIITTFDTGGQCGINGGCEYEEFGFERIAWWRTPSWIDVNAELMNRYYTPSLSNEKMDQLSSLRSAHNFWYVYARQRDGDNLCARIKKVLEEAVAREVQEEGKEISGNGKYDFEATLDECGFGYNEEVPIVTTAKRLWQVNFD